MSGIAVYPGSFDPPTLGHLDVIERALRLFDHLVVAVGRNQSKTPFLSDEERIEALRKSVQAYSNVSVEAFDGLLIDFAQKKNAQAIIRGLRATSDFEYEFQMAMVNRRMNETIESVFLMTRWEHSYLSSSIVREVALLGGDYSAMVPHEVAPIMGKILAARRDTC
jgi:pantetheine-phosphate adenylyltransferase